MLWQLQLFLVYRSSNMCSKSQFCSNPEFFQTFCFSTWVRCGSVDKKSFIKKLQKQESLVFVPGGVQEVTLMDPKNPNDLILYLKSRKGFIKLALLHGSPIIPVFCFNCDNSYQYWFPKSPFVNALARKIGFLPLVFWGRFGIPFGIPKTQNVHVVIGSPIDVPCDELSQLR